MPKYFVNVSWSVFGSYDIQAVSKEEAKEIANRLPLPQHHDYIEGSFQIDDVLLDGTQEEETEADF